MICKTCGKELAETAKFCGGCGTPVASAPFSPKDTAPPVPQQPSPGMTETPKPFDNKKLRHGFTSFWLWLVLIFHCLVFLALAWGLIDPYIIATFLGYISRGGIIAYLIIIGATISGLWDIIRRWKRSGFYLFAGGCLASFLFSVFFLYSDFMGPLIGEAVAVGITFAVLHIRNSYNALSTWEQMN